jgi:sugar phosphate isomerase/epimerase
VFVAASTSCLADLSLVDAMERLADLRFTCVEIDIHEQGNHLKPAEIATDPERATAMSRPSQRLTTCAYSFDTTVEGDALIDEFKAICRLAKATKVVTVVVRAAELGTPFNAEVERLRDMVAIASLEGIVVGMKTEAGRMSEDPSTIITLCKNVPGLGIALDPSHFVCGPLKDADYDRILEFVCHVHLRDTSKDEFQVRVGQGEIEYGRLVSQLTKQGYRRALCVDIGPIEGIDQDGEMRKLRLLLESLL